jgi:streptogrisin C
MILILMFALSLVQTPEEALAADARWYARDQGVSQEEAVRRLRIQTHMGGLIGQIRRTYKTRLAGIIVEHEPVYRVRIRLTGTSPVAAQEHAIGGSRLPVIFETGAKATVDDLVAAMTRHQEALKRLYPTMSGLGADERTSEIVIYVYAPDAKTAADAIARLAEAQTLLGLPARIEITDGYPSTL